MKSSLPSLNFSVLAIHTYSFKQATIHSFLSPKGSISNGFTCYPALVCFNTALYTTTHVFLLNLREIALFALTGGPARPEFLMSAA